ncbi:MAG TPA: type II secretion system secretin GspD [Thiolinea sp.]|nr:type II secretion system secretin GspD [Thiolinea sp.]
MTKKIRWISVVVSASVLFTACTSIKDSPGYRSNVNVKANPFQRSAAIKELDQSALGLLRSPSSRPASTRSTNYRPTPSPRQSAASRDQDVELIIGNHQYYRDDVERPNIGGGSKKGGIALNFERASIREVVAVILGDILKETYIVEPGVEGEVTINSSEPIPRSSLIPTLESLLQTQGAVLYRDDTGGYRVAARANIKGRGFMPSTGGKINPGYSIQVVPLRYIPVAEMQKILEPLASPDAFVRVDTNRNLLVLAGTSSELASLMATIRMFDVDVLQGMSVGMYKIKNVEAQVVAKNLDTLFGESGNSPMAGMVKIVPIEHMNSIMIISASPEYLREMKHWVERFDKKGATASQQLYVYHVQNGNAEHLAEMLSQIFSGKGSKKNGTIPSSLAPGLEPVTVGGDGNATSQKTMLGGGSADSSGGVSIDPDADVKIVADKTNNSLMILSTEQMYRQIQEALKRIDIMPMQVQVEASIMEVTLTDQMEYGVQWYFKNSGNTLGEYGINSLGSSQPGGFSFTLMGGSSGVKGFVNAIARQSKVKVISSPSVLVLDNQTAEIRVGDQQPIYTGTSTVTNGQLTDIPSYQYKDTGVSLQVTPHVNSNGLVKMDVTQDITDVGEVDSATGQRSFLQRKIKSNIAVQSGETIVLGGLIRENQTDGDSGVPVLKNLPIVGDAFKSRNKGGKRTELLVLITPTAIKDQSGLNRTGQEMRDRMKRLFDDDTFLRQLRGEYVQ